MTAPTSHLDAEGSVTDEDETSEQPTGEGVRSEVSPHHGQYTRYTAGCRCTDCKAAKAAYMRQRRAAGRDAARARQSNTPLHPFGAGGRAAYLERGCRCFECREATTIARVFALANQRARNQQGLS